MTGAPFLHANTVSRKEIYSDSTEKKRISLTEVILMPADPWRNIGFDKSYTSLDTEKGKVPRHWSSPIPTYLGFLHMYTHAVRILIFTARPGQECDSESGGRNIGEYPIRKVDEYMHWVASGRSGKKAWNMHGNYAGKTDS